MDLGAIANVYLNPGHGTNYRSKALWPDNHSGPALLLESQWEVAFNNTGAPSPNAPFFNNSGTNFSILSTPFLEYPFVIVRADGVAIGIENPSACNGTTSLPHAFLKDEHVYGYRCIGKSFTLSEKTSVFTSQGTVKSGRKPSDVDLNKMGLDDTVALTIDQNERVCQRVPVTTTDLTKIPGYRTTDAKNGCYAVSHHETMQFTYRDLPYKKTGAYVGTTGVSASDRFSQLYLSPATTGVLQRAMSATNTGVGCVVSAPDNTDMAFAVLESLPTNGAYNIKFTVVHELLLKASSPSWNRTIMRPAFNPTACDTIQMYENFRSRLTGGGTLFAVDNDWASIWTGFKNFLERIKGGAVNTFNRLAGAATSAADGVLGGLGKAASIAGPVMPLIMRML